MMRSCGFGRSLGVLCLVLAAYGAAMPGGAEAGEAPEATSQGLPKRADGWWELSLGEAKQHYCVGKGSEEKFSLADMLGVGDCSKRDFQRIAGGWRFETVCSMMGNTATQTGTVTGDFRLSYRIVQEVSDGRGSRRGELLGRRLGDCPADRKPGDLVSYGMTLNMLP